MSAISASMGADGHHNGAFWAAAIGTQAVEEGVVLEAIFRHVGDEHGRLGRDQEEGALSGASSSLLKSMPRTIWPSFRQPGIFSSSFHFQLGDPCRRPARLD
jgi:hypothetical protein